MHLMNDYNGGPLRAVARRRCSAWRRACNVAAHSVGVRVCNLSHPALQLIESIVERDRRWQPEGDRGCHSRSGFLRHVVQARTHRIHVEAFRPR